MFDIYGNIFCFLGFRLPHKISCRYNNVALYFASTATVLVIVVAMLVNTLDYITGVLRSVFVWWWGMWVCGGVCVF